KHVKIALNVSRDIPFSQLVLSQANVRRVKAGVSIDTLAADIARRGLLQSLSVRPQRDTEGNETGLFEVPAGGRRFRALQQLVKANRIVKTQAVPCIVRDDADISAEEDSLAENTHREALHPLDQFRAMRQLVQGGTDIETVAATFMVTPAVVKQRLKLASVSPKLHQVYADDGMSLEQLMAFSVSEDHARQEQVWDLLQTSYNKQPYFIRSKLTEDAVRASDKRVCFVGLDSYVAAGGYVLRDLFESDDGGWLQDVALLDRLVNENLQNEAARIGEEGWKWIAVAVDFAYGYDDDLRELQGVQPDLTDDDEAKLAALRAEADAIEDEWSGMGDLPEEIDARVNAIDEEIAGLVSRPLIYDPVEIARAGAFISIDADGSLYIERGFVRPEDEPVEEVDGDEETSPADGDGIVVAPDADDLQRAVTGTDGAATMVVSPNDEDDEQEDLLKPLPDRLVTELTTHRTLALRDAVAAHPTVAFAAVLHAFVLETFYRYTQVESCIEVSVRGGSLSIHAPGLNDSISAQSIERRHDAWKQRLPEQAEQLWDELIAFDGDDQAALFAHCASFGINAVWEPSNRYNDGRVSPTKIAGRIEHSHIVARASDLDMVAAGWSACIDNYFGRVTKARIMAAVNEARGPEAAARIASMKKGDMAKEAELLLEGSAWLAEPLRTPVVIEPVGDVPDSVGAISAIDSDAGIHDPAELEEEPLAIAAE
ncbi:MAG: ParB/RepB/Spo0J family partition protein, partial [Sphingobium sp.]